MHGILIGELDRPQHRLIVESLRSILPRWRFSCFQAIGIALAGRSESETDPEIVFTLQSWPDEFPAADVQRLLSAWPLARFVCAFGPWCEADGRNRAIWPESVRVPIGKSMERIRIESDIVAGKQAPLPLTAGRDEAFLHDRTGAVSSGTSSRRIRIDIPDNSLRKLMTQACADAGHRVVKDHAEVMLTDLGEPDQSRQSGESTSRPTLRLRSLPAFGAELHRLASINQIQLEIEAAANGPHMDNAFSK